MATIYGNPKISLKTRLNKSLIESTRRQEPLSNLLEASPILTHNNIEEKGGWNGKRPKSSQNFIFRPANAKTNLRPTSKPKYEESHLIMPSVGNAELASANNVQKAMTIYPKRSTRIQKKVQKETKGNTTGSDKFADIIVNMRSKK